jgi:AcrR family transcriptional regulator
VGVSSGAPYRHFADRDDLLDHVAAAGFDDLRERSRVAWAAHPPGTLDGLVEAGCAYIRFGAERPELFHLMWGATRAEPEETCAVSAGVTCYGEFLGNLGGVMRAQGLGALDPATFAQPLWAMVHGYAALLISGTPKLGGRSVEDIRPGLSAATRAYFAGVRAAREAGPA